jgi:hypothetical protein
MSSRGKQAHKKDNDIQKLEWDKRKNKREDFCNMWYSQNSNRKMVYEGQPDRAHEQSQSEMNRPELEITTVVVTPDIRSDIQLIEDRRNSYQLEDKPHSMDYEYSGPNIRSSLIPKNSP